jgi:hypothetical protein
MVRTEPGNWLRSCYMLHLSMEGQSMAEDKASEGRGAEAPTEAPTEAQHRLGIYHKMMTTGMYLGTCSCGTVSPEFFNGGETYRWFKKFHPEAQP